MSSTRSYRLGGRGPIFLSQIGYVAAAIGLPIGSASLRPAHHFQAHRHDLGQHHPQHLSRAEAEIDDPAANGRSFRFGRRPKNHDMGQGLGVLTGYAGIVFEDGGTFFELDQLVIIDIGILCHRGALCPRGAGFDGSCSSRLVPGWWSAM